jgi:hypothetical protein
VSHTTPSSAPVRIGEKLRIARIDRHLSLEETAWRTRVRPDLLRALEDEEFDELGHHATVRSHVSSYARFLGIDAGELVIELDALRDDEQPSAIEELDRQRRESRKPPRAKWLIFAAASLAVLAAASVTGWLGGRAERPAEATAPVEELVAGAVPTLVPAAEARVRLRIVALSSTHLSVSVDGRQVYEGPLKAGEQRFWRARDTIELLTPDGDAVSVTFNGERLGVAGEEGKIYRARFGPTGILDD